MLSVQIGAVHPPREFWFYRLFVFFFVVLFAVENEVCDDAENERAGNGGELDVLFAESHYHAADAGDKDRRYDEQVVVLFKIDLLDKEDEKLYILYIHYILLITYLFPYSKNALENYSLIKILL